MSNKIQVTLDATKLRNLVTKRNYKNKDGKDVELQEVKFELVPVKEPKTIFTKDNMRIDKTHFASVIQTKEERDAKAPTIYIGEGFSTIWLKDIPVYQAVEVKENPNDDLPF
jgi:hypothetical protein